MCEMLVCFFKFFLLSIFDACIIISHLSITVIVKILDRKIHGPQKFWNFFDFSKSWNIVTVQIYYGPDVIFTCRVLSGFWFHQYFYGPAFLR